MAPIIHTVNLRKVYAVGKVDHADDTVNHGVAQRDQRINSALVQAVDQALNK